MYKKALLHWHFSESGVWSWEMSKLQCNAMQCHIYSLCLIACLFSIHNVISKNRFLIVKALVGVLLGAFPRHCEICEGSLTALVTIPPLGNPPAPGGDMLPKHSHEPATSLSGVSGNNGRI